MGHPDDREFLKLYQTYRYGDQLNYYTARKQEFGKARTQVIVASVTLMFVASIASIMASSINIPLLKLVCLLLAAICPALSTPLAAYSTLYGFEQQAKLYQDTINALLQVHTLSPDLRQGLSEEEFTKGLDQYVHEIENIFLVEQGQWGQLAQKMKASET